MISQIVPGLIIGFREGMEAFLIIGIMLGYLDKIQRQELKKSVKAGMYSGILGSVIFGLVLWSIKIIAGNAGDAVSKLWESGASFLALVFISTLIYWMMRHGTTIAGEIRADVKRNLSTSGLFILAAVMVIREGAEIALFAFSAVDKQLYTVGIFIGIFIAAVLAILINKSLIKVNLSIIFNVTLGYLILQAAYMLGYSIHEFLSALKSLEVLSPGGPLLIRLFDLSGTILDHKTGILGIPLNILLGWYSKPEILQFIVQYSYILGGFILWRNIRSSGT